MNVSTPTTFPRRRMVAGIGAVAAAATVLVVPRAEAAPSVPTVGQLRLAEFDGVDDDARLDAAIAYARAQTMRGIPIVLDEPRDYRISRPHEVFSGFCLTGSARPQDQARSSMPIANRVLVRTDAAFTLPKGNTFGICLQNLSLDGSSSSTLLAGRSDAVLWTSVFRDLSAQNFGSLFGSISQKLLNTACTFDGWWNINNVRSRAWVLGGSDTTIIPSMMLIDSPPALLGDTQFLIEFSSQSKMPMQNLYVSAEGHSAARWTGGSDRTVVSGGRFEGRNAGAPCKGALIRIEGSDVTLRDCWLAYAMAAPSATGRNDAGVVHVTGGSVLLDGIDYERASGVAESVPLLYASGGRVRVRNVNGRGFSGKPVVRQAKAGLIDADSSVTVVTG